MTRQTSFQMTEATDRQVDALRLAGFGTTTDIIRIAIDRMAREEIMMDKIMKAETLKDAAAIHCRYFYSSPVVWTKAMDIRDRLIDSLDPEWPHEKFWEEVERIAPDPRD